MGTQFSKVKVTQRVEVHGQVIHDYCYYQTQYQDRKQPCRELEYDYSGPAEPMTSSAMDLNELLTRRAHHSGVVSGHELMSYAFLGGRACEPRRSIRRRHRSRSSMSLSRPYEASRFSSDNLPAGTGGDPLHQWTNPASNSAYITAPPPLLSWSSTMKYISEPWRVAKERLHLHSSGTLSKAGTKQNKYEADPRDSPDSELDSGISSHGGNYDHLEARNNMKNLRELQDYERIEEFQEFVEEEPYARHLVNRINQQSFPSESVPKKMKAPSPPLASILMAHYKDNFSDWFEPVAGKDTMTRRSSKRKKLHQKLVMSKMNAKKAAKLDMDDRAKILQYFSRPVGGAGDIAGAVKSVNIEDMFGKCWCVPNAGPPLPTIVTVQAPAGIGKSSMLKYMCMKWGCGELWADDFDVILFVECRTLNRLGSMTGREFLEKTLEPVRARIGEDRFLVEESSQNEKQYGNPLPLTHLQIKAEACYSSEEKAKAVEYGEEFPEEDIIQELSRKAAIGRILLLLDGLDEIHGVGELTTVKPPAGHPDKPGFPGKGALSAHVTPLEFTQCLLTGSLLQGCHIVVTSRPHTLSHLQSSKWFLSLPKRMVSLDIQGLSEEGVESFIHSYVDARLFADSDSDSSRLYAVANDTMHDEERPCTAACPCQKLLERARNDPYIFSLATNPFYLWLICTIYTEAGEDYVPKTLTQLYTWVMLVFANRWQNTSLQMTTNLNSSTLDFLSSFSKLCYHLVQTGNIKIRAILTSDGDTGINMLSFPELEGLSIDMDRAETFGLMIVSQSGFSLECEFRHLSLAEYMTALHIHTTGGTLKGFPRDRKELILQYLSGLASRSTCRDQMVVRDFLFNLGSSHEANDPLEYLKHIQKMKGEWYNQPGLQKQMLFMRCAFESRQERLSLYPFPGLKIINIRGSNLLALDLIIIGSFVTRLADNNRLMELALRDYPLDLWGLNGLIPCIPLVRTVTICMRNLPEPDTYHKIAKAVEESRSRLRELWLLEVPPAQCGLEEDDPPPDALGHALNALRETCRLNNVKVNV